MSIKFEPDPHYIHRTTLFENLTPEKGAIVFLGDSITEMCEWQEFFPEVRVVNRGVSGDSTRGVLRRVDLITALQPSKVFITIGVNDLQRHYHPGEVVRNISETLKIFKKETEARLYLQSILPVMEYRLQTGILNQTIDAVNHELRQIAEDNGAVYIDNNILLSDETGNLAPGFSEDGLHINGGAYKIWADNIRNRVLE
ncbi:MAG: sialate O-acetylesterase [Ignavibacteriaceae bacterium]|nr:MAG: platelet activating factor [Chlorobiota bacterium]GJQ33408.1 MAG: sialate O-acetylesterase [Ignavibacteriaceae bacterium]